MSAASTVPKLYYGVMDEVIANVRDAFIDEGADEQTLTELKQIWKKKLIESKAIEREPEPAARTVAPPSHTQVVQPQNTHVAPTTSVTHQLAMTAPNVLPQAVLQYATTTTGDGQKTMLKLPQKLTLTVPANIAQTGLQTLVSAGPGATAVQLPPEIASLFQGGQQISGLPFHPFTIPVTTTPQQQQQTSSLMGQMDGTEDTSDEDDEDDFPDNDDDGDENDDDQIDDDAGEEDEEPLNSADDVSDEDPSDLFDTENVVVCQYDKITRSKNRWKFHLKDGIMNLQGKDFVFQKALGDSEW